MDQPGQNAQKTAGVHHSPTKMPNITYKIRCFIIALEALVLRVSSGTLGNGGPRLNGGRFGRISRRGGFWTRKVQPKQKWEKPIQNENPNWIHLIFEWFWMILNDNWHICQCELMLEFDFMDKKNRWSLVIKLCSANRSPSRLPAIVITWAPQSFLFSWQKNIEMVLEVFISLFYNDLTYVASSCWSRIFIGSFHIKHGFLSLSNIDLS